MISIFILHSSHDFYISACLDESLIDEQLLTTIINNNNFKPKTIHKIKLDVVFSSSIMIRNAQAKPLTNAISFNAVDNSSVRNISPTSTSYTTSSTSNSNSTITNSSYSQHNHQHHMSSQQLPSYQHLLQQQQQQQQYKPNMHSINSDDEEISIQSAVAHGNKQRHNSAHSASSSPLTKTNIRMQNNINSSSGSNYYTHLSNQVPDLCPINILLPTFLIILTFFSRKTVFDYSSSFVFDTILI